MILRMGGMRFTEMKFRAKIRNLVAKSPHYNKNVVEVPVFESPDSERTQHSPGRVEGDGSTWWNWKQELVEADQINWKEEIENAQPDEGSLLPPDYNDSQGVYSTYQLIQGSCQET